MNSNISNGTEATADILVVKPFRVIAHVVKSYSNTKAGATLFTIRKNGLDAGTPISIGAAENTTKTEVEAILFEEGDTFGLEIDRTASGATGAISWKDSIWIRFL
jgi:hypothetical protein